MFVRADRIVSGFADLRPFLASRLPAAESELITFPVVERIASIALLKRYEQLQDIVGQLGRIVLSWELEDISRLTRRDFANKLERLGVVDDADDYMASNELRNRLVHEYPLDEGEQVHRVNASWEGFPRLVAMIDALRRHMVDREFDFDGQ